MWEEYNFGVKGDKVESGWKIGIYGVGGWSEYEQEGNEFSQKLLIEVMSR